MAGVIGIYGLIIAVILGGNIPSPTVGTGENIYSIYTGMAHVSFRCWEGVKVVIYSSASINLRVSYST